MPRIGKEILRKIGQKQLFYNNDINATKHAKAFLQQCIKTYGSKIPDKDIETKTELIALVSCAIRNDYATSDEFPSFQELTGLSNSQLVLLVNNNITFGESLGKYEYLDDHGFYKTIENPEDIVVLSDDQLMEETNESYVQDQDIIDYDEMGENLLINANLIDKIKDDGIYFGYTTGSFRDRTNQQFIEDEPQNDKQEDVKKEDEKEEEIEEEEKDYDENGLINIKQDKSEDSIEEEIVENKNDITIHNDIRLDDENTIEINEADDEELKKTPYYKFLQRKLDILDDLETTADVFEDKQSVAKGRLEVYIGLRHRSEDRGFFDVISNPIRSIMEWWTRHKLENTLAEKYNLKGDALDKIYNNVTTREDLSKDFVGFDENGKEVKIPENYINTKDPCIRRFNAQMKIVGETKIWDPKKLSIDADLLEFNNMQYGEDFDVLMEQKKQLEQLRGNKAPENQNDDIKIDGKSDICI